MSNGAVKKKRPVYLNLVQIRMPVTAFISILHRISGALLFVAVAWLLFMLDRSLASEAGFEAIRRYAAMPVVKLALLLMIWAYCHHFFAGIRYLFLDLDKGTDLATARLTSWIAMIVSLAFTAVLGAKLLW
jgi:succinate dehydrogenase / fumarate reductase cytochrome b subunit